MVTYGKTLGGGLPIGVLCGRKELMKRFRDDRPADICFARGTFNSHPYVMAAMHEFLQRLETPGGPRRCTATSTRPGTAAPSALNQRLRGRGPAGAASRTCRRSGRSATRSRLATTGCCSIYLRAEGLALSWVGTGRFIFSLNYTDADFDAVADKFVAAARAMQRDGFWWSDPALTNKAIKRRVLREMLAHRFGAPRRAGRVEAGSERVVLRRLDQLAAQQVASGALWYSMMSWNGSVRILVNHTSPVFTPRRKNRWIVRNSSAPAGQADPEPAPGARSSSTTSVQRRRNRPNNVGAK